MTKIPLLLVSVAETLYCHPELDSGLIYIGSEIGDPEFNTGPGSAPLLSC